MNDLASGDANIQTAMLEVISEAISGAVLVYDKTDTIVFASHQLLILLPVPKSFLAPGTRLRDFLGAIYDGGGRFTADSTGSRRMMTREHWIADQIALFWKERSEAVERRSSDRWIGYSKRRLSSGYGVCVIKDISDLKKREEQWRADLERVQVTEEVLDHLPFPVCVMDRNMIYVAVNKALCDFLERPADAILGRTVLEIHPDALSQRLDGFNRQVLETGVSMETPARLIRADGSELVLISRKFRIGKPGRYYVVSAIEDLTNLLVADPENDRILAAMTGIDPVASHLSSDEADEQRSRQASTDIGNRKVLLVTADPRVQKDALDVLTGLGTETSCVASARELDLFLKFSSDASVAIDLVVVDTDMDIDCLEVAERRGVSSMTIDGFRTRRELRGLVIRHFQDYPNGHDREIEDDWQISAVSQVPGIDILVAEDNAVNQIVFSQILEAFGYRYAIAADGDEAVRIWQEQSPKLILMDITLPIRNGFEASARIRAIEKEAGSAAVPIIGVLPQAFDRDRQDCLASGMNDIILKPISPEALEAVLTQFLEKAPERMLA